MAGKVKTIIVKLEGGLGNQFYQYCAAKGLSEKYQAKLKVLDRLDSPNDPRRHNHLGLFSFEASRIRGVQRKFYQSLFIQKFKIGKRLRKVLLPILGINIVTDPENGYFPEILQYKSGTVLLLGYWQSYRYFEHLRNTLLKELQLKSKPKDNLNISLLTSIDQSNSVAIHIRRGDYVSVDYFLKNFGTCSIQYYENALNDLDQQLVDPQYFIFSDDPDWVKKNLILPEQSTFIIHNVGKSDYEDFRLMMHCKHFIIANSSFSWWAAWLGSYSDKKVIAPANWFNNDPMPIEDRIPKSWKKLEK